MGELTPRLPHPTETNSKLEAALERWKRAAEGQRLLRPGHEIQGAAGRRITPMGSGYKNQRQRTSEPLVTAGRQQARSAVHHRERVVTPSQSSVLGASNRFSVEN